MHNRFHMAIYRHTRHTLCQIFIGFYSAIILKTPKNKHAENILHLLEALSQHGTSTTWQLAKKENRNNLKGLRTMEKEYRRLIIGRDDKKRHNFGLLEQNLVVRDGINYGRGGAAAQYRLSLHGILCCIEVLDLDNNAIDMLATKYSNVLPKVFGKWDFLKSIIGNDVYKIRILAKGIISDNLVPLREFDFSLSKIMSFIHLKYKQKFENILEEDLAEQISLWFYTNLLYTPIQNIDYQKTKVTDDVVGDNNSSCTKLTRVLSQDADLKKWYNKFLSEIKDHYKMHYFAIKKFKIF